MIKILKNKKGMTLMEVVVGMLTFSIIVISVTIVLPSILGAYDKANDLAEINTMLDNLTFEMLSDLSDATEATVSDTAITIKTNRKTVTYSIGAGDNAGLLLKDGRAILEKSYYKGKTVKVEYYNEDSTKLEGTVSKSIIVKMILLSDSASVMATRDYAVKPLGLSQY